MHLNKPGLPVNEGFYTHVMHTCVCAYIYIHIYIYIYIQTNTHTYTHTIQQNKPGLPVNGGATTARAVIPHGRQQWQPENMTEEEARNVELLLSKARHKRLHDVSLCEMWYLYVHSR
jgi:hypothetical protein